MNLISSAYSAAVSWRRQWYARDPSRTRRLGRPVISVGNLRAGGSGKTPVVAHLARLLADRGERPAILTRGYARSRPTRGVTVVSDGRQILADFAAAGDEPLMLARQLAGVPVLVGADRFLSGQMAERDFGVTVHLLDDGFQHMKLARDVDLLLADETDLTDRVLPAGHLREPIVNAVHADAVLVTAPDLFIVEHVARALDVTAAFRVTRTIQQPRTLAGTATEMGEGSRVFAFAGIARPQRFFTDLAAARWSIAGHLTFRDHHSYNQPDVDRIVARAREAGASAAVTTEKDAVRLAGLDFKGLSVVFVPLIAAVEPSDRFTDWLLTRIRPQ